MPCAQRLDLIGRHDAVGEAEQDHGDAVVVRRAKVRRRARRRIGRQRLEPGAQVAQDPRQIAVAAEREHVGDLVAHRGRDPRRRPTVRRQS